MKAVKAGIQDSFQDEGRFGYAKFGINPSGSMDQLSMQLANILVGNPLNHMVLEMHFPASILQFTQSVIIALVGADFGATANNAPVPCNRRLQLPPGTTLRFLEKRKGERCYLAVYGGWKLDKVLGSFSTQLKTGFGGWKGRSLKKEDEIPIACPNKFNFTTLEIASWGVKPLSFLKNNQPISVLKGVDWDCLSKEAQQLISQTTYTISEKSDRMGYLLKGIALTKVNNNEMVSAGVVMGTVQLLPTGQPLVLMADHQTSGGYPRILQIVAADLHLLAQMGAGDAFRWQITTHDAAIQLILHRKSWLQKIETSIQLLYNI